MQKPKIYSLGLLIIFLMLSILSVCQLDLSSPPQYDLNLNSDDKQESWSTFIKSGPQFHDSTMVLIDNHTYVMGSIGEYYTSDDIYIAKFNSSGTKLWEQTWGGSEYDVFKGYAVDSENNIYIVGITDTFFVGDSGNIFLLKYNTIGNLLWSEMIDPFSSNYYAIHSINIDLNDSVYLTCKMDDYTIEKSFITKISTSGIILWTQEIELTDQPFDLSTEIDSDGNIYLLGHSLSSFLLKLNSSCSRQWNYEWGERNYAYEMGLDLDENIILTGSTTNLDYDYNINHDVWIMKINSSGNLTNKVTCKNINSHQIKIKVWFLDDIFIIISKRTTSFRSFLLKYNYSLNSMWNFTFDTNNWYYNFGINSKHEMYLLYSNYPKIDIIHFNSSNIISYFEWGGYYSTNLHSFGIDSNDNLYILCNNNYANVWYETTSLSVLVKNPKIDGRAPQLNQPIDDRDIFIFSLLGVMSFISVILVYNTLKPKLR